MAERFVKEEKVTRVFHEVETVAKSNKQYSYACVDQTRPILTLDTLVLKNAFLDAKNRGVKLHYVTEITKDNLPYCKQLILK